MGWWNYPTEVVEGLLRQAQDDGKRLRMGVGVAVLRQLRMKGWGLRMKGKRLRMEVLVDEDRLEIKMRLPCSPAGVVCPA